MSSRTLRSRRRDEEVSVELGREQRRREEAERALVELRRRVRELERQNEALRHEALHDALTGLPNRRALEESLQAAVGAARRHGHALTVCMLDLDGFKLLNDLRGHLAGDAVLARVGATLREELRVEDVAARLGGDEFCLAFPHTAASAALAVVERVRARLAAAGPPRVTATFGLAELDPEHQDATALLEAADLALYRAKRGGKNRSAVFQRPRLGGS